MGIPSQRRHIQPLVIISNARIDGTCELIVLRVQIPGRTSLAQDRGDALIRRLDVAGALDDGREQP